MNALYQIRPATTDDIPILVSFRRAMFECMGVQDEAALARASEAMTGYLASTMPAGTYQGWVAEAGGQVIASGGVTIHVFPPSPRNVDSRQGYIMNIYTVPEWRGKGIATAIVIKILEYLNAEGVPVARLHASDAGRPIYARLGFTATNEMRLRLRDWLAASSSPDSKPQ